MSFLLSICFAPLENDNIFNSCNDDHFNSHLFSFLPFFLFQVPESFFRRLFFDRSVDLLILKILAFFSNCYCFIFKQSKSISRRFLVDFFSQLEACFWGNFFDRSVDLLILKIIIFFQTVMLLYLLCRNRFLVDFFSGVGGLVLEILFDRSVREAPYNLLTFF